MGTIHENQLERVKKLYLGEKLSAKEIAQHLHVQLDAVYYFLRRHRVPRRSGSESSRIKFDKKASSYDIKKVLTVDEERLRLSAVLLYWCEGYKTEKSSGVDFANSDLHMVLLFLRFLREVCRVDETRIKVLLYCHDESAIEKLVHYWSDNLYIPKGQFTKPYVMQSHNLEKKHKMPYGLVHIRYYDKKLLWQILEWIEEYKH
jgi:hypothetical protein